MMGELEKKAELYDLLNELRTLQRERRKANPSEFFKHSITLKLNEYDTKESLTVRCLDSYSTYDNMIGYQSHDVYDPDFVLKAVKSAIIFFKKTTKKSDFYSNKENK